MVVRTRVALCRSFLAALTVIPRPTAAAYFSSMSFTTERNGGTITISPQNEGDQSGLVVICHGLGDTSEGFADVAEVSSFYGRPYGLFC
jgi:alpha-beta hydrolase superfamily lysophospholipase